MEQLCLSIHQLLTQLNDTFTQNYQPIKDMTSPESNPLRIQYSQQLLVLISAVSDILTKANKDLKKTIVYQQEEISRLKREKVAAQKVLVDNSAQTEPDVRQIEREQRLRSQLQRLREFAEQKHYENKRLRAELTQNVLLLKAQEALLEAEKEERSFEGRTSDDFSLASSLEGIAIPKKTSQPAARYSRQEEARHRYREEEEEEAEEPAEEERTSQHEPREFPREDIPDDPRPHPPPHPPHPPHLHPHPHPPRHYGSESNPHHPDSASEPCDGREDQSSEQAPPAGDKEEEDEEEDEEEGGDGGSEQLRLDGSSESLGDLDFFQRIYDEDFRARHPLHQHPEEV